MILSSSAFARFVRLFLMFPLLGTWVRAAETDVTRSSTNDLVITSTNGSIWTADGFVYRGEVRVLELQMYLECDLLRGVFETNSAARPMEGGLTNANLRLSSLIAETNLLIMFREATVIGDRAVYTATNEGLVVTGELVILQTDRSLTYCTNVVVNRKTGEGYVMGWNHSEMKIGGGMGFKAAGPPRLGVERRERTPDTPAPGREGKSP
jgi:hypothetical protein